MIESFYSGLYANCDIQSGHEEITDDFMSGISESIPRLSEDLKEIYEGELTFNECFCAIRKFQNNKSPRSNGLTSEFYKTFWPLLGKQRTVTLNFALTHEELTINFSKASYNYTYRRKKRQG